MPSLTSKVRESSENRSLERLHDSTSVQFVDNRATTAAQCNLVDAVNNSPRQVAQRQLIESQFGDAVQLQAEDEELLQGEFSAQPIQRESEVKPNNTGLPGNLKSGIENLSGYSMDDVKVHYNSDKPSQLQAHAYAQGTDIHVASGQEKHLPHEAWHVVQQKQGRVKPTMQMKQGVPVNDDARLEKEADVMGYKASQGMATRSPSHSLKSIGVRSPVISRYVQPGALARGWYGFPNHFTIADDGTAATGQKGDKLIYATAARRAEANNRLAAVGSPVVIAQHQNGGQFNLADMYGGQTISRLIPTINPVALPLAGVQVDAQNAVTDTPADCMNTAKRVTGQNLGAVGDTITGGGNLPGLQRLDTLAQASNLGYPVRIALANAFISTFQLNKRVDACHTAYQAHKDDVDQDAMVNVDMPVYQRTPGTVNIAPLAAVATAIRVGNLGDRTTQLIAQRNAAQVILTQLEAHHNLNAAGQVVERKAQKLDKYADPDYGQAYASVQGGGRNPGHGFWNYHWGGIIMKTATDNVTLENHASLNDPTAWDIRMYGRPRLEPLPDGGMGAPNLVEPKDGQSWHEQWSLEDFGDNPSTMTGR